MGGGGPSLFERMLLRFVLAGSAEGSGARICESRIAPVLGDRVPRWGSGRVDTFNPYKSIQFNWPLDRLPPSELIGAADYPSLWNQAPREGMQLHWDGDNDSVDERNLSAALGAGVTPVTVDHAPIKRVRDWIWKLPPPKYPYPIDQELAAAGAPLYAAHCQSCHADNRFRDGVIAPGTRVGRVDADRRHRHGSSSPRFIHRRVRRESIRAVPGLAVPVHAFQKDERIRESSAGRHLAAGAVPAQRLGPDAPRICSMRRTRGRRCFTAGYDVFDQKNVGFVSDVPQADGQTSRGSTRPCPATATADTCTARRCPTRTRPRWSST